MTTDPTEWVDVASYRAEIDRLHAKLAECRAATLREAADRLDALPPTYKIPGEHETWTPYHEGFDDGRDRAAMELRRQAEEG